MSSNATDSASRPSSTSPGVLLAAARGPQLAEPARQLITMTLSCDGGATERLFRCQWDQATQCIADPVLIARGNRQQVSPMVHVFRGGELALHNHPTDDPTPSDEDLTVAEELAVRGVGFAIVNRDLSRLHVVTTPDAIALRLLEATIKRMRRRSWHLGPFTLLWASPARR